MKMVMTRWNPYNELRRMRQEIDRMWGGQRIFSDEEGDMEQWVIPLDVVEEDNNILVKATVPGIKPEDLEVTLDENMLTIKGSTRFENEQREGNYLMRERRAGSFHRMLRLPDTVDTERAESYCDNGVLTVSFPKTEAKKAKRLNIGPGRQVESSQTEGSQSTESQHQEQQHNQQ
jgi:HSP20 family protein